MFFIIEEFDIASYVDDKTPYMNANNTDGVFKYLEETSTKLFKWFIDSLIKSNDGKYYLLVIINSDKTSSIGTLIKKDGSVSIHNRNIQALVIEM